MTQRVGCHVGDPKYPGLNMIASLMVNVASGMSNNVFKGLLGRARCNPKKPLRVIYTLGAGIPTPDCKQYGCTSPTVDGDKRMPIGTVGEVHNLNSPALGALASHEESMNVFVSSNTNLLQKQKKFSRPEKSIEKLGFFATVTKFDFKKLEFANVASFITNPGHHMNNAFGGDFNIFETMLKFALEYNVDLIRLESPQASSLTTKACPPPPINWGLWIGTFSACVICCGCCCFFGRRKFTLGKNRAKKHTELSFSGKSEDHITHQNSKIFSKNS